MAQCITDKWSHNFVRHLNLCPWAAGSLENEESMRHHILFLRDLDRTEVEKAVRLAGSELINRIDEGKVSERHGISFVTILPNFDDVESKDPSALSSQAGNLFEYGNFHTMFLELENAFLDEADNAFLDKTDSVSSGDIGSKTIIAAFHPRWTFAGTSSRDAINYEKRSPFPTISIVSSKTIDELTHNDDLTTDESSAAVTVAVAEHNEQVLEKIGGSGLQRLMDGILLHNRKELEE
eukprot:CAMPEP_0113317974 /NCGR_PEP_ID=MMETSP0010_2-20120614/12702_1 /TAXON_ID=216773 ORGANISM="Corethron hystrix, Strain 308" /NCGR_SAMPLE_ID=MMETSP0010_2 /ASSEMBLY_ACC=CAM_ASM_000155 /LENGTH=236 /DNA_ID=CAMNT_0000175131 /DNA_START=193 /DNA_END=903 /DNA_ORIENTATION=- /assembly_acc=CAM_ASM_000155